MKLLLADPDRDFLEAFGTLLTLSGYCVTTAFDGTQVIQKLSFESFGAVIINSDIPRIPADEIISKCREKGIPTVIVTDRKISSALLTCGTLGNTYIQLPFLPNELSTAIRSVVDDSQSKEILSFEDASINTGKFTICDELPVTSDEINIFRTLIKKEPISFRNADTYITSLNYKLEKLKKSTRIRYLISEGYRLVTIKNG